jgi:chromosome segregation ATPase
VHGGINALKNIRDRFALIEERVRALRASNNHLSARVSDLEQELAKARRDVKELEHFRGRKLHIKERIENILRTLESMGTKPRD